MGFEDKKITFLTLDLIFRIFVGFLAPVHALPFCRSLPRQAAQLEGRENWN